MTAQRQSTPSQSGNGARPTSRKMAPNRESVPPPNAADPKPEKSGRPSGNGRSTCKPVIIVDHQEYRVNDEAADSLKHDARLYQRGRMLVHVLEDRADKGSTSPQNAQSAPIIRDLPNPLLRETLTRCADWKQWRGDGQSAQLVSIHPPDWCVSAVAARRYWPEVRWLEAVLNYPVLLPEGTILQKNGYDAQSHLMLRLPRDLNISVNAHPTRADLNAAVATLSDTVSDFPFETPAHRAAWLAGLLTPLAWFAFTGPAPLFLVDANIRAAGKGLLTNVSSHIITGRRFSTMSYTPDREELRKRITSLAMEGDRMVLLDNLTGMVGNDVLDAALTSDHWKDRVLGSNKVYDGPLHVTWYGTGNNVQFQGDTPRRICHIRLESLEESPERRTNLRYPQLLAHVQANRGDLLTAALTILRAWVRAGRPKHGLSPWGSFEGWSDVVRESLVFAGLPDPGETRIALQTTADGDMIAMTSFLDVLVRMDPEGRGLTTGEIIDAVRYPANPLLEWYHDLRSTLNHLCDSIDSRALGYRLRHFKRRNFNGRMIDSCGEDRQRGNRWVVRAMTGEVCRASCQPSPASPVSPEPDVPETGDAGDAGDESRR